jgi:hypothetical protein
MSIPRYEIVDKAWSVMHDHQKQTADNLRDALRDLRDLCVGAGFDNKEWFLNWQVRNMVTLEQNGFPISGTVQKTWVHNPAMRER